jgi:hypothetical protein
MPPSFNVHRTSVLNTSAGEFARMGALPNKILLAPAAQGAVLGRPRKNGANRTNAASRTKIFGVSSYSCPRIVRYD